MTCLRLLRCDCALLVVSLILAAPAVHAQAEPSATVRITPASVELAVNQTADVAVEVRNVQALYGADVTLTFNPDVIEVVDADPQTGGVQVTPGTFLDAGFVVLNRVDNASGTVRFAMTQLSPSEPKSGTGTLIVVKVRGRQANAASPLTLASALLAQRDGTRIAAALSSGQVVVTAAPASNPPNTLRPTQDAGVPLPVSTPTLTPAVTERVPSATPELSSPVGNAPGKQETFTPTATSQPSATVPQPTAMPVGPGNDSTTTAPAPEMATPAATALAMLPIAAATGEPAATEAASPVPAAEVVTIGQAREQSASAGGMGTLAAYVAAALLALTGGLAVFAFVRWRRC